MVKCETVLSDTLSQEQNPYALKLRYDREFPDSLPDVHYQKFVLQSYSSFDPILKYLFDVVLSQTGSIFGMQPLEDIIFTSPRNGFGISLHKVFKDRGYIWVSEKLAKSIADEISNRILGVHEEARVSKSVCVRNIFGHVSVDSSFSELRVYPTQSGECFILALKQALKEQHECENCDS